MCHDETELVQNRSDASSIGPIPDQFWPNTANLQGNYGWDSFLKYHYENFFSSKYKSIDHYYPKSLIMISMA